MLASHLPLASPSIIFWDAQSQQTPYPAAVQLHTRTLATLVHDTCHLPSCFLGVQFLLTPFPSFPPPCSVFPCTRCCEHMAFAALLFPSSNPLTKPEVSRAATPVQAAPRCPVANSLPAARVPLLL